MKLIDPCVSLPNVPCFEIIYDVADHAYVCTGNQEKLHTYEQAKKTVKFCIEHGHESVLEHIVLSARIRTSRSVMAELTRHRIGVAFSIQSQRYVKYDDVEFIKPATYDKWTEKQKEWLIRVCAESELEYKEALSLGLQPQEARNCLNNACATVIDITANLREWRTIFKLRCDKAAHPDIRYVMGQILSVFKAHLPVVFDDIQPEE